MGAQVSFRLEIGDLDCRSLRIAKLAGDESISKLFELEIVVACLDPTALDADEIIERPAAVVVERGTNHRR